VVPVPLHESKQFDLDLGDLASRISPRTRLLVLNSPHNPTGAITPRATLEGIAELARKHDFMVLADEIYGRMVYEGEHVSIASLPGMAERTVVCDGFSKTYAMTGWRLGFGIMERALAAKLGTLMNNSNSCTTTFVQKAALAALRGPQDEVVAMMAQFAERRRVVVEGLNRIPGLSCQMPGGAFYAFPNIRATGFTSAQLADRLLDEAGVVTLPGTGFGPEGEGYLRLSYANSVEALGEGLGRIAEFLQVNAQV
jgi:aspartate/methionine/tyrosine aminotransferase